MNTIKESGEMYLESVLILSRELSAVRATDIADYMHYSRPSVSRAVGLLEERGLLSRSEEGFLQLTESGREVACKMYERHLLLTDVLIKLGVDRETATTDACKIEHDISEASFEAIKKHVKK